jgi:LysM repeat protein
VLVLRAFPAIVAVLVLASCAPPAPPLLAPALEPEPEEVDAEPAPAVRPQIPVEERIRAPFAVQSDGRPAPREPRRGVVAVDPPQEGAPALAGDHEADDPDAVVYEDAAEQETSRAPAAAPIVPAAGAPDTAAPAAGSSRRHVVQAGETFFAIARRYEVTPMALAAANPGVDNQRLRVGQVLRLPEHAADGGSPTPAAGTAARPAAPQRTHRVAAGETLWSIARRYDVTMAQIRAANRMSDDIVRIGQTLIIPGG